MALHSTLWYFMILYATDCCCKVGVFIEVLALAICLQGYIFFQNPLPWGGKLPKVCQLAIFQKYCHSQVQLLGCHSAKPKPYVRLG